MSQNTTQLPTTGTLGGLNLVQDINQALDTLASNFLGATAPTAPYPGQYWIDTGTTIDSDGPWVRQRKSDNSGWVRRFKCDMDFVAALLTQDQTAVTSTGTAPAFAVTTRLGNSTGYAAGQRFRVKFHATGSYGSNTLNRDGLGAVNLKQYDSNGAKQPAVIVAGMLADVEYDGVDAVVLDPLPLQIGVPVGSVRNAKMSVTAASASAIFTADEVVVESTLGGAAYKIASFNKSINLATTGAGGMDTGSAPVSGYVALYAIYNPTTGASALLAVNATSAAAPNVYGGSNMPAGYTASALVSVWPTNASSQFIVGFQRDRKVWRAGVQVFSGSATVTTSVSLSSVVPPNATEIFGGCHYIGNSAGGGFLYLMPDTVGTGQQITLSSGANVAAGDNFLIPIITPQTMYYYGTNISTGDATINGYSF